MSTSVPSRPDRSTPVPRQMSLLFPDIVPLPTEQAAVPSDESRSVPCPETPAAALIIGEITPEQPPVTSPSCVHVHPLVELGTNAGVGNFPGSPFDIPTNLAEVVQRLMEKPPLKRNLAHTTSAIRAIGRVLGRPLSDIPANPAKLGGLFAEASPALIGMRPARWSRVRSLTLAALRDAGDQVMPGRDIAGLSTAWRDLCAHLPNKRYRNGLSRLLSFFTREGIEPGDADITVFTS